MATHPYPPISIGGNAQGAAALLLRHANQHHPHPTRDIQQQLLIGIGGVDQLTIQSVKAPKLRCIGMQEQLVIPCTRHWNCQSFVGIAGVKTKYKNQVASGVG